MEDIKWNFDFNDQQNDQYFTDGAFELFELNDCFIYFDHVAYYAIKCFIKKHNSTCKKLI